MSTIALPAINRSLTVAASPDRAFEVFTARIADWWPTEIHSIAAQQDRGRPDTVVLEPRVGGRLYEREGDEEHQWANVLIYDPPNRLVLEWKVNPKAPAPTEIEVTFTPEGDGTRVDLEHRGWDRLGDLAEEGHKSYDEGWDGVLACYENLTSGS